MKKHVNRNRSFDRLSYIMYDKKAREAMVKYLTDNNFTDIVSKEDYNFDIYAKKNKEHFFEVEVKTQWRDKWNSSWKEIRIPERKQRLINIWREKYPQHDFKFVIFNKADVGTIQNSRFTSAPHLKEPFFHIPVEQAELVQITDG